MRNDSVFTFAVLLLGCPSSTPDDSAVDSAPPDDQPVDENCDDGADNDLDGLADCEDPDCMESCLEDCSNGEDDDADGDVDCYDDECSGEAQCSGFYTLELTADLYYIGLWTGPHVEAQAGYGAVLLMFGELVVDGTPDDPYGQSFRCEGDLRAFPSQAWYEGYAGTMYLPGSGGGGDYTFLVEPDASGEALEWGTPCPTDALPRFSLALTSGRHAIMRQAPWGDWYVQYSGQPQVGTSVEDYGLELDWSLWYSASQAQPVSWRQEVAP